MRQCRTCGESKPLMDFYSQTNGNLHRDCKECWKAYVKANRLARADQYREYERGRASLPHRVEARQTYSQTPNGKAAHQRAHRRQNELRPAHRAARIAVGNALRSGNMARQPCEVCGDAKAQAHHDDYSKPLDVRWLCTKHHAEWHRHNEPLCPQSSQDKSVTCQVERASA